VAGKHAVREAMWGAVSNKITLAKECECISSEFSDDVVSMIKNV